MNAAVTVPYAAVAAVGQTPKIISGFIKGLAAPSNASWIFQPNRHGEIH